MSRPPAPASPRRRRWVLLGAVGILLFLLAALPVTWAFRVEIPASGSRQTVLFYAAPTDLSVGARMDVEELEGRLRRAGYQEAEDPVEPGTYRALDDGAMVHLRAFRYPDLDFPGGRVVVRIEGGRIAACDAPTIVPYLPRRLEPERIAGYEGRIGAVLDPIRLDDAPPLLAEALIAVEDRRFYHHPGIDPVGTLRALVADIGGRDVSQGGSTLTQQLARSLYLHNRKTILRKLEEAVISLALEIRYSKREILEAYLNAVYWGYWGTMEIRGAREAARYYLDRELEEADAADIALLVGLVRAPNAYSPYADLDRAKARRDLVLRLLESRGVLSSEEVARAIEKPIPARRPPDRLADAPYFLDAARREVERRAPKGTLDRPGAVVFTTLDPRDQAAAVSALRDGLQDLERRRKALRRKRDPVQGAVVVIDPPSGEIRALVGGRDYARSPFNRALDAPRQPGSSFKPFVYLAAFRHPRRKGGGSWTPATVIEDEPLTIRTGRRTWSPPNYDRTYRGRVSLRVALELSLNVPTVRVGQELGIDKVAATARDLGIASRLDEVPALALGTSEVTLLEITGAYAGLAAGGRARATTCLRGILASDGGRIPLEPLPPDPPGIEPREAYLLTRVLQGVVDSGTGRAARSLGVRGPVAGKTGTTDEYRDSWFVGYSPRRAAGVWVGFDRPENTGLSGSTGALPIWSAVMRGAMIASGDGRFRIPRGIVTRMVCPESGLMATSDCPEFLQEEFIEGTAPNRSCDLHGIGIIDKVRRIFRL